MLLPITSPQFICYNSISCSNAIIRANVHEGVNELFASKYINCYFKEASNNHKFVISIYDHWCTAQRIMYNQHIELLKETAKYDELDLLSLIKKCISAHAYVFVQLNNKYVDNRTDDENLVFDGAIIGYDDNSQEIIVCGVNRLDIFSFYKIGYEDAVSALMENGKDKVVFSMWSFNNNLSIQIDLPNIIFELEDYLNSCNRRNQYTSDKVYGLDAYKMLAYYYRDYSYEFGLKCLPYFDKFKAHKEFMLNRINCLIENGILRSHWKTYANDVYTKACEVIVTETNNCSCEYRQKLTRLSNNILDCIAIEKWYLNEVLLEIKQVMS